MGAITIVGLGPGSRDDITIKTLNEIETSEKLYLRTIKHPVVDFIIDKGIKFTSFDYIYDTYSSFDEVYETIATRITEEAIYNSIVYAVPGNPLVAEESVKLILEKAKKLNIAVKIIPALSFIDAVVSSLRIDPIDGLKIIDGLQLQKQKIDKNTHNIITQCYNKRVLSDIKLKLMEYYEDDFEITIIRGAGIEELEKIEKMPLYMMDRCGFVDYLTSIYLPPVIINKKYDFDDVVDIMKKLRSEDGCPWDKEQTHESLKQCLIEECYEVIDAIDKNDIDGLCEELGDVLLQVVFHSQIAFENDLFNVHDVCDKIVNKMIKRHSHIFGDVHCETSEDVIDNWERIKLIEHKHETITDSMRHVPNQMPALLRSFKVQKKAARVGFDWNNIDDAIKKIKEEINEYLDVYKSEEYGKIVEELGDILFATVNVCRFNNVMPEFALNSTTDKFIRRFEYIEKSADKIGIKLQDMTLEQMNVLWNMAKKNNL